MASKYLYNADGTKAEELVAEGEEAAEIEPAALELSEAQLIEFTHAVIPEPLLYEDKFSLYDMAYREQNKINDIINASNRANLKHKYYHRILESQTPEEYQARINEFHSR